MAGRNEKTIIFCSKATLLCIAVFGVSQQSYFWIKIDVLKLARQMATTTALIEREACHSATCLLETPEGEPG